MAGNDVKVDVKLDTDQAERDAEGLKGKLSKAFGDMGKIAGGVFMAEIGGAIAAKGVDTLKESISAARDFNEIQSKSNTVFKDSADAINKWAATASTGFGQSKAQALDSASAFGNMFTQLGMGSATAADMSMKMTELASDFASFHNADITEVINAQQAAFRGEYDALQKFVPTINAAAVQTEALAMTGKTNAASLTEQEKAAATYSLILKGAGDAQGDFDRTSTSLANQQRILSAQWQDLQVKIGQVLIPALTEIVTAINTKVIPAIKDFGEKADKYYNENIKPAIENLKNIFNTLEPVIRPILEGIGNHINNIATILRDTVNLILAIVSGDWSKAWNDAKKIVEDVIKLVKDDFSAMVDFIRGLAGLAKEAGIALFNGIKDGLSEVYTEKIWPFVKAIPGDLLGIITGAVTDAVEAGKSLGGAIADGISSGFDWIIGHVTGLINTLIRGYNNTLGRIGPNIPEIGGGGGGSQFGAPVPGGDDDQMPGREVFGQSGGGGGGVVPSYSGGMGNPSYNYQDPRGVTLTANDILAARAQNGGFVGLPAPIVINIDTVNAATKEDAVQAGGDIAYAIRARGGMLPA